MPKRKPKFKTKQQQQQQQAWDYAHFLSPGRRIQVVRLAKELEEAQFTNIPALKDWQSRELQAWIVSGLDVIAQWARLGQGGDAERCCRRFLKELPSHHHHHPSHAVTERYEITVRAHRRVLHAWCNELIRTSSSSTTTTKNNNNKSRGGVQPRRSKRTQSLPPSNAQQQHESCQQAAQEADQTLRLMEQVSRDCVAAASHKWEDSTVATMAPLLDGSDYLAVIVSLVDSGQVPRALHVLRQWRRLFLTDEASSSLPRLAPTARAYTAVMKGLVFELSSSSSNHQIVVYQEKGKQYAPIEMAHVLWEECCDLYDQSKLNAVRPGRTMYHSLLDGWSKALPRPSFKSTSDDDESKNGGHSYGVANKAATRQQQQRVLSKETVASQATLVWNSMSVSERDARGHVLMIYTYCKCHEWEEAFRIWEALMERLLSDETQKTKKNAPLERRVDSRSFRMLVRGLAHYQMMAPAADHDEHSPDDTQQLLREQCLSRITQIIQGMWKLHEAGYNDTAPDVYLYTTAMNAWADSRLPSAVEQSRALLDDLKDKYDQYSWDRLQPDAAVYNALVNAIAHSASVTFDAAKEAGSVVKSMIREGETTKNPKVLPDTITYNTLMDACLASGTKGDLERAEQTLRWMAEEFRAGNARVKPILRSYSSVIEAWAASPHPGSAKRAEELLDLMEERYRPPVMLYEQVILAWCREADLMMPVTAAPSPETGAAYRAYLLLERMEELFLATGNENEISRPSGILYDSVIKSLKQSGQTELAVSVEKNRDRMYPSIASTLKPIHFSSNQQVFDLVLELKDKPPRGSVGSFHQVLSLLAKSGTVWAAQRAEDVLNYMLELYLKRDMKNMTPSIVTFNTVMAAWARSTHPEAGAKAAAVLEKLESLHKLDLLTNVTADRISYNTLMSAYAKSADPESAELTFRKLEHLYETEGDENLKPDRVSWVTLLNAWASSGEQEGARRAEEILLQMQKQHKIDSTNVKPDTQCFNEVIYAHARGRGARSCHRAEMVLSLMEDLSDEDVRPNTQTYNIVLYALANSPEEDAVERAHKLLDRMTASGDPEIQPDLISYSTVLFCCANQGGPEALEAIELVWNNVLESDNLSPDSDFVSNVIYSLSRTNAKGAPAVAEGFWREVRRLMKEGKLPNVELHSDMYNALIHCWARSGERGAPERAEQILRDMQEEYNATGNASVLPNVATYTSVMDAYAKSRDSSGAAVRRAEALLQQMVEDERVSPNAHTYTAVLQCHARSDHPSKATRAQAVLHRMKDEHARDNRHAKPTVAAYNAVLNACEFSSGETADVERAFRVACQTLEELQSLPDVAPDDVTYATFLGVVSKLMPKSEVRFEMVELLFRRCCAEGLVGPAVFRKLKDAASPLLYKRLLGGAKEGQLPSQWTRNVVSRTRRL